MAGAARTLWSRVARATLDNPVLVKEFRTRMRGTRAYWLLLGYTLLLAGVVAMMYFAYETTIGGQLDASAGGSNPNGARELGRQIYTFIFISQAILVALITPALTSGAVTVEREQRSYELLVTTPLRGADLIRGKLLSAVSFVVLLLTASVPLVSLSFLVGGVSPAEIFFSYLLIALSAAVYGALGIFWSATLQSTAAATVLTYLAVLFLFIVSLTPGFAAMSGGTTGTGAQPEIPFQSLNPVFATTRAVLPEYLFTAKLPSWIASGVINLLFTMVVSAAAMARLEHFDPPHPVWIRLGSTLLWCAAGLFLFGAIFGASYRWLNTPGEVTRQICVLLTVVFVLLVLAVPVLNTGDLTVRPGEDPLARYISGFLPHRMFAADLSSGLPLTLLWSASLCALVPIGFAFSPAGVPFDTFGAFLPGVILIFAAISGLAGVGHLLSVFVPSRWAACILTYLTGVVLMVLPYLTLIPFAQAAPRPRTPQLLWQTLYLLPSEGLVQLHSGQSYWSERPEMLLGRGVPMWVVTTAIYLFMAAACFAGTAARIRQEGRRLKALAPEPGIAPPPRDGAPEVAIGR